MAIPVPPEGGPVQRPSESEEPAKPKQNGAHLPPMPARELRVIAAIEELSAARKAAGLSAGHYVNEAPATEDVDRATEGRLAAYAADIDAAVWGAYPEPLARMAPPLEPDTFLVEGMIRPGTTVMLTGPPGTSKSWISRQLALACGAGQTKFLDHYPIPRPLNVLVVDEDNGAAEEWRRDEVLLGDMGLTRSALGRVQRLSLAGVQLDQEAWQHWLRGNIRLGDFDLVILDPISEMHGGKELREDPAFRSLLGFLKRLKVDFPQMATLLVHHTRKTAAGDRGTTRGLDDVRGQWGQTPDVVLLLTNLGERRARWEIHKRMPGSTLILEAPEYGPVRVVADETTAVARTMSADHRVMAAIEAGAEDWEQILHATGMSKSGIFKVIGRLRKAGIVTKQAPYQLVEGE